MDSNGSRQKQGRRGRRRRNCPDRVWISRAAGQTLLLAFVFGLFVARAIRISHLLIDTRKPLEWWARVTPGAAADDACFITVSVWRDEALHLTVIALAALLVG